MPYKLTHQSCRCGIITYLVWSIRLLRFAACIISSSFPPSRVRPSISGPPCPCPKTPTTTATTSAATPTGPSCPSGQNLRCDAPVLLRFRRCDATRQPVNTVDRWLRQDARRACSRKSVKIRFGPGDCPESCMNRSIGRCTCVRPVLMRGSGTRSICRTIGTRCSTESRRSQR